MAADTVSSVAGFFQTKYRDHLGNDVPKASKVTMLWDKFARKIEAGGSGLNVTWSHKLKEGVGSSALTEAGTFPTPMPSSASNPALALTHQAFSVEVNGHIEAMGSKASWLASFLEEKGNEIKNKAKKRMAQWAYHTGTSYLGQILAVSASGANEYITIKANGWSIHLVEKGDILTVRDLSTAGSEQLTGSGDGTVVDVDYVNERIYLAHTQGAAADDYVAWSGYYDATVPNGIRGLVDSAGTIQGIARATVGNDYWKAHEATTTSALSSAMIDELRDTVLNRSNLRTTGYNLVWAGNYETRRFGVLACIGQNRFANLDFTLGVPEIKIGDMDGAKGFVEDQHFVDGELYAFDPSKFVVAYPEGEKGGHLVMNGGSPWFQKTGGSTASYADSKQMFYVMRYNFGIDDARCMGKVTGFVSP